MALTWYETKMTSNTEPSPLVASASSSHVQDRHYIWGAFDGIKLDYDAGGTLWASVSGQSEYSWVKIDFGEKKKVNVIELTPRSSYSNYITYTPIEFFVEGSNTDDDEDWTSLGYFYENNWVGLMSQTFVLNEGEYRYFKITNVVSNHSAHSCWVQIKYGYTDDISVISKPPRKPKAVIYSGGNYLSIDKNALVKLPELNEKYIDLFGIGDEGAVLTELTHRKHIYETGKNLDGATIFSHKINTKDYIKNHIVERID